MTPKSAVGNIAVPLALIAGAILMHEILLTRIFSVTMMYHFAFLAISVAMFGLTAGAMMVFLRPSLFEEQRITDVLGWSGFLFALTLIASLVVQVRIPQGVDGQWRPSAMAVTYAAVAVPYFFGGVFITGALIRYPANVSRLYAADLVGAALGCVAIVYLLEVIDALSAVFVVAAIGASAAGLLGRLSRSRALPWSAAGLAVTSLAIASFNASGARDGNAPLRLIWVKGALEESPIHERWNSYSRIIVRGDSLRRASPISASLSPNSPASAVAQLELEIDARAATILTRKPDSPSDLEYFKWDLSNLVHHIRPDADVMVVGVGGGRDLLSALAFEQRSVVGVEVNTAIVETLVGRFGAFTGHLDQDPRVTIINDEARSHLERHKTEFDVIQISMIDTWAATAAGAFVFTENALYTEEAWELFLRRLTPDGILSITRWYNHGFPGEIYRSVALAASTLREAGIANPRDHLAVVRLMWPRTRGGWPDGVGTILISRSPLTDADVTAIRAVAERMSFEVVLDPAEALDPSLAALLDSPDLDDQLRAFQLDLSPPTDDDPFFFQMLRPAQMIGIDPVIEQEGLEFNIEAVQMLGSLILIVTLYAGVFIVAPIRLSRSHSLPEGVWPYMLYFSAIGLGFMFIEIAQLQRLNLFLGHPTYGTSVALFSLLLSGGLGSFTTASIGAHDVRRAMHRFGLLVLLLVGAALLTPLLLRVFSSSSVPVRIGVSVALLAPIGFLMGMAFPLGIRLATTYWRDGGAWLWGINGAMSVLGSVLAMALAITFDIPTVFFSGIACYVAAAILYTMAATRAAPPESAPIVSATVNH